MKPYNRIKITGLKQNTSKALQALLFADGYIWGGSKDSFIKHSEVSELVLYLDVKQIWLAGDRVDSVFDIRTQFGQIVDKVTAKKLTVKLNEEYTAEVSQDGKTVEVGCQTIVADKVLELAKMIEEARK